MAFHETVVFDVKLSKRERKVLERITGGKVLEEAKLIISHRTADPSPSLLTDAAPAPPPSTAAHVPAHRPGRTDE
jgi:hypothetical protein